MYSWQPRHVQCLTKSKGATPQVNSDLPGLVQLIKSCKGSLKQTITQKMADQGGLDFYVVFTMSLVYLN